KAVILGHVQAAALRALHRDAGPDHLAQPVHVERDDVEPLLERLAHALGPWLRTEEPDPELESPRIDAGLRDRFGQMEGVGRRAAEHGTAEVLERRELPIRETA